MNRRRIASPAAAMVIATALFLGGPPALSQAHTPAPAQTEPAPQAAHAAATTEEHPPAHGAEAGAHHGPEVRLFGIALGNLGQFLVRVVNFGLFFAILYFILKGALSSAFKARAKELEEQLSQAEKDKAEGEARLKELEARMAGMQAELDGILARSEVEAESEKQRVLEAARAEAGQILTQARSEIEYQKRVAEKELRALVAELAVEGAAARLRDRVQGPIAEQVLDRAIQEVGGAK